jgi:hypothetical protein
MKYLKKFNEELKSSTYLSASRKLKKMGHVDRADRLKDWGIKREMDESMERWRENVEAFSRFGEFKFKITNPETGETLVDNFYLILTFDELVFSESIDDGEFPFFVGIIPKNEETIKKCEELMPAAEFGNGFYWAMFFNISFDIVQKEVKFKSVNLFNYDESLSGDVNLADRASAGRFKNLISKIFSESDLNYGYTDGESMYEILVRSIMQNNGFSDYTSIIDDKRTVFELDNVSDWLKKFSANQLYK